MKYESEEAFFMTLFESSSSGGSPFLELLIRLYPKKSANSTTITITAKLTSSIGLTGPDPEKIQIKVVIRTRAAMIKTIPDFFMITDIS
jgi:hypothetical protein